MNILLTGGCGYIGSHTAVRLLDYGHEITIVDDFSNAQEFVPDRIKQLTGKDFNLINGDIRNKAILEYIFGQHNIDAVMHFAGLKSVKESIEKPLEYYGVNVSGTINLLEIMGNFGVHKFIFSSSATVYGACNVSPLKENMGRGKTTNPYGKSKAIVERILQDLVTADSRWEVVNLRYFNPIGAHPSGLIGEIPKGTPNNIMPLINQVATGEREYIEIFGNDYPTPDGTCLRDYIHVLDLADGHIASLKGLKKGAMRSFNLGTGHPYSVSELISTYSAINAIKIETRVSKRRDGDIASVFADPRLANETLNWYPSFSLHEMVRDAYNWSIRVKNGMPMNDQQIGDIE